MENSIRVRTLKSFFNLFEARVSITKVIGENNFYGTLYWEGEEDTQDFKWTNIFNEEALNDLNDICGFVVKNQLNDNDKILIAEDSLRKRLVKYGWNFSKIENGVVCLMAINIRMIDEGEETDSFFMHF